jgi:ankyrin repeat protein
MALGWSRLAPLRRNIAWSMVLLLLAGSCGTCFGATPEPLLWRAAQRGDVQAVRLLLTPAGSQEIALDGRNDALWSAISSATRHPEESKQIIQMLLEHGADVNAKLKGYGHRPSYLVESPEQLQQLLDIGADVSGNGGDDAAALGIACNNAAHDPVAMLTLLLAHGAQIPGSPEAAYPLLRCAVTTHRPDLEEFLLAHGVSPDARRGTDKTVLFDAPDAATIEPLLRHGADINAAMPIGATALGAAIEAGRVSKSLLLLARGADANARGPIPELTLAAAFGQLPVVSALLAHGADTGASNGDTALEAAVGKDAVTVAELLLTHGADVNGGGMYPGKPLHDAALGNSAAMVSLLLSHHADITAKGSSAVPAYREATSQEVLAVFARAGAPMTSSSLAAIDAAACREVVSSGLWRKIRGDHGDDDMMDYPQDPRDDWGFQDSVLVSQHIHDQIVHLQGQDYVLGVWAGALHANVFIDEELPPDMGLRVHRDFVRLKNRTGPVYLLRRGPDGVASVVCEFRNRSWLGFSSHGVMTPLERVKARARRESLTLKQAAVKEPGLWGAQALLEAGPGARWLASESGGSALGGAIESHRLDILEYYLDHGVSPDLQRSKHVLYYMRLLMNENLRAPQWYDDPLFTAIESDAPEAARLLLEHGANPNAVGDFQVPFVVLENALAWTVIHGQLAAEKTLLEYGAEPNLDTKPSDPIGTTLSAVFAYGPRFDAQVAGVRELFAHGADADPFLSAAVALYARINGREALLHMVENAQGRPLQSQAVREAITLTGDAIGPGETLIRDALAFRDATDCKPDASATQLAICLPNTLKRATAAAGLAQRSRLRAELNRRCRMVLPQARSHAGWLSSVLSDQRRALCVLDELRRRGPGV